MKMKVKAILNNYCLGSYPHKCLEQLIISEIRLDRYHTEVIWDLENQSQYNLLVMALGNRPYRLKVIEEE